MADGIKEGKGILICHSKHVQARFGPHRLSDLLLVSDRLFRIRSALGCPTVLTHRTDPPEKGRVHVLRKHVQDGRAEAGGEESAKFTLSVEGEPPVDRLVAYVNDGDDLIISLARKIVSRKEEDAEAVEEILTQAKYASAEAS